MKTAGGGGRDALCYGSGMLPWTLIALGGVAAVGVVPAGLLMALRPRPAVFPYTAVFLTKSISIAGPFIKKQLVKGMGGDPQDAREVPNDIFQVLGDFGLVRAKRVRDALLELD